MSPDLPSSSAKTGIISTVIAKLTPRLIVILLLVGILVLFSILAFAIYKGASIDLWGFKIGAEEQGEKIKDIEGRIEICQNENREYEEQLNACVSASDLSLISEAYFNQELTKNQLISEIKGLVNRSDDIKENESHYSYKLFKLERLIAKYGRYVDTRVSDEERRETYKIIQDVLRGIKYYQGPINGDQQLTYEAVAKFQREHNERAGTNIFNPEDFGILGYGTLEAIRSRYRLTTN